MASSFVVKRLVASSTIRSLPVVVPYFHRPAALLAITYSSRRAFATTPIPKYSYEHHRLEAKRLWFNFTDFVSRFSPFNTLEKILDKTPHTFCLTHDSQLEASGDIFFGVKVSLNFPGIAEMKETHEGLFIILDTGLGNLLNDFTHGRRIINTDHDHTVLTIDVVVKDEHKCGNFSGRIDLPAGLKDAKWETGGTKDGLLIICFSKVKQMDEQIETKDNGVVK